MMARKKKSSKKGVKKPEESDIKAIDISVNFLVPKHRLMSEEEAKELLEKYKVDRFSLPWIAVNDPAIRHMNAKDGDIIEITRKDYVGEYKYYRVVLGYVEEEDSD